MNHNISIIKQNSAIQITFLKVKIEHKLLILSPTLNKNL